MLWLSEVLIQEHEMSSFKELIDEVKRRAREDGEMFFRMDVRPPFKDTPENWEEVLEGAFTSPNR